MTKPSYQAFLGFALAGLLSACGGGSGGNDVAEVGSLTLALTDAPVDEVFAVNLQISGVSIKPQSGPAIDYEFSSPVDIDGLGRPFYFLSSRAIKTFYKPTSGRRTRDRLLRRGLNGALEIIVH